MHANVVIMGPFGVGSLADEAVLAGLLKHLVGGKHQVTVLSADPARTAALHKCRAAELSGPNGFLSAKEVWAALENAHLFLLAGAGVLSTNGRPDARQWLQPFEHVKKLKAKTAVVGVGALPIDDPKERVRLQRLLHNHTMSISVRDDAAKAVVLSYGMQPVQVAVNGDPTLALQLPSSSRPPATKRVGLVLSSHLPSRDEFSFTPVPPDAPLQKALIELVKLLSADAALDLRIFHDNTGSGAEQAAELAALHPRAQAHTLDATFPALQKEIALCSAVFSLPLQGISLAAASGAVVAGVANEPGAAELIKALGLPQAIVSGKDGAFDPVQAQKIINELLGGGAHLRDAMRPKLAALARREAQIGRMFEYMVPQRERYPERTEAEVRQRTRKKAKLKAADEQKDPWFHDKRFS